MQCQPDFVHHFGTHTWRTKSGCNTLCKWSVTSHEILPLVAPGHSWAQFVAFHCDLQKRVELRNIWKQSENMVLEMHSHLSVWQCHPKSKVLEKLGISSWERQLSSVSSAQWSFHICLTFLWMGLDHVRPWFMWCCCNKNPPKATHVVLLFL